MMGLEDYIRLPLRDAKIFRGELSLNFQGRRLVSDKLHVADASVPSSMFRGSCRIQPYRRCGAKPPYSAVKRPGPPAPLFHAGTGSIT